MASSSRSTPLAPARPAGIRLLRPYDSEEAFVFGDGLAIGRLGMILMGAPKRPNDSLLRFDIVLASGEVVFRGEGRVIAYRVHASGRCGLEVRFTRLDARSKSIVERVLKLRQAGRLSLTSMLPTPPPPGVVSAVVAAQAALPTRIMHTVQSSTIDSDGEGSSANREPQPQVSERSDGVSDDAVAGGDSAHRFEETDRSNRPTELLAARVAASPDNDQDSGLNPSSDRSQERDGVDSAQVDEETVPLVHAVGEAFSQAVPNAMVDSVSDRPNASGSRDTVKERAVDSAQDESPAPVKGEPDDLDLLVAAFTASGQTSRPPESLSLAEADEAVRARALPESEGASERETGDTVPIAGEVVQTQAVPVAPVASVALSQACATGDPGGANGNVPASANSKHRLLDSLRGRSTQYVSSTSSKDLLDRLRLRTGAD